VIAKFGDNVEAAIVENRKRKTDRYLTSTQPTRNVEI